MWHKCLIVHIQVLYSLFEYFNIQWHPETAKIHRLIGNLLWKSRAYWLIILLLVLKTFMWIWKPTKKQTTHFLPLAEWGCLFQHGYSLSRLELNDSRLDRNNNGFSKYTRMQNGFNFRDVAFRMHTSWTVNPQIVWYKCISKINYWYRLYLSLGAFYLWTNCF